jgi:myo-inositol-1(or 4)-monophosphatase
MQSNIGLLIDAIRGAAKFLHRDYSELENLQSSTKNTKDFVERARIRVGESLQKALSKYYKTIVFDIDQLEDLDFTNGPVALLYPLAGKTNLTRAIPFFAVIATILVKKNGQIFAEKIVINFPALGEIYYAEKGKGAWIEKNSTNFAGGAFRLRVSGTNKLEEALVACNSPQLPLAQKLSSNLRNFGSCSYQTALLISGKVDCALFQNKPITDIGFDLIIREAGGLSSIQNGTFVGSNYQLHSKIKELSVDFFV